MTGRRHHGTGREAGQSLLEFALVIPIFLALLLGIVDVGRAVWANNTVANAAREAARFAAVHGGAKGQPCPVGPLSPDRDPAPPASPSCPHPSPSKESIRDTARGHAVAPGTGMTVEVCYGSGCSGDIDAAGASNARGTPVTVRVSSQVPMIVGNLLGLGTINVSATSTMLVNF
jgi:TadE-like protein